MRYNIKCEVVTDKYNTRVITRFGTAISHSLATKIEATKAGFYLYMPRVSICPNCGKRKDWRAKICGQCKWWGPQPTEKVCNGCGKTYPIEQYSLRPSGKTGHIKYRSRCRDCEREENRLRLQQMTGEKKTAYIQKKRQWEKDNPDKIKKTSIRSTWKKKGFNPDEIEEFFKLHNTICDICGMPEDGRFTNLSIDHDHNTGKIRGMLCNSCNLGLGKFKDNLEILQKAIDYLKRNTN